MILGPRHFPKDNDVLARLTALCQGKLMHSGALMLFKLLPFDHSLNSANHWTHSFIWSQLRFYQVIWTWFITWSTTGANELVLVTWRHARNLDQADFCTPAAEQAEHPKPVCSIWSQLKSSFHSCQCFQMWRFHAWMNGVVFFWLLRDCHVPPNCSLDFIPVWSYPIKLGPLNNNDKEQPKRHQLAWASGRKPKRTQRPEPQGAHSATCNRERMNY